MSYKTAKPHKNYFLTIAGLLAAIAFLAYVASVVRQGTGPTQSRATRDVFLTPGDDALSLQEDLNNLASDPGAADEAEIDAIQ